MKVKSVDIARALGISKATVSLALNGKPGVNEKTRQEILACKERMEQGASVKEAALTRISQAGRGQIKVVLISNGMKNVKGAEMDLWTDVKIIFQKYAQTRSLTLGMLYFDIAADPLSMLEECNHPDVEGVVVLGTELRAGDERLLKHIRKPLVIYDCDLDIPEYPCVMVNNRQGIELAVDRLVRAGHRNIVYLGNPLPMYNYESRRRGFADAMASHGLPYDDSCMRMVGSSIEEAYQKMISYLDDHPDVHFPEAFIMDSYHISIGVIRALREKGFSIPEDVSLIGVDLLPPFLTGDRQLTSIRVPHTERAYWVMQMLFKEIDDPVAVKSRLYMNCELIEGETVAERGASTDKNPADHHSAEK